MARRRPSSATRTPDAAEEPTTQAPPTVASVARAVAAWVDRTGDPADELRNLPPPQREIASTIARLQCEQIKWHADRLREKRLTLSEAPDAVRGMVRRYFNART